MKMENLPNITNEKEKPPEKEILKIQEFADFRGLDLKNTDFSNFSAEILKTCNFDTETKWPDNLPKNFNPKEIIENGKNPGLGIKELHKEGITGEGVNVAIIDQKFLPNHKEYSESIARYEEMDEMEFGPQMHGSAVSSLLVGKECGVAPGSKLHYFAMADGNAGDRFSSQIERLIEYNKNLPKEEKIKVVSISNGLIGKLNKDPDKQKELIETIREAEKEGMIIIFPGFGRIDDTFEFLGTGSSSEDKDNPDNYEEWLSFKQRGYKMNPKQKEKSVLVPSDYRAMASWKGDGQYQVNGVGGISWATPYLAGVFALALQVNPELKKKEILEKIEQTATKNKNGLKIINPKGLIELIKSGTGK